MSAITRTLAFMLLTASAVHAQSTATLQGRVFDASGASLRGATIAVSNQSSNFHRSVSTDDEGRYHVAAIPVGMYVVTVTATDFRPEAIEELRFEVGRTLVRDFRLEIGDRSETVLGRADVPLIDRVSRHRRPRGHSGDRAGDSAERPSLHRSRVARAGVGGAIADRVLHHADTRGRCARVQHGRQSRGGGRVPGQRRDDEQPDVRLTACSNRPLRASRNSRSTTRCSAPNTVTCQARSSTSSLDRAVTNCTATRTSSCEMTRSTHATSSSSRRPEPHPFERHQFGGSLGGSYHSWKRLLLRDLRRSETAAGPRYEQPRRSATSSARRRPTPPFDG